MKYELNFWIDFDHCFWPANYQARGTGHYVIDGPIVEDMMKRIQAYKPDMVCVSSFSNRQDAYMESKHCTKHNTASSIVLFTQLVQTLQTRLPEYKDKIFLDEFLLNDAMHDYADGETWDAIYNYAVNVQKINTFRILVEHAKLNTENNILKTQTSSRVQKGDLFYCKAHHQCQQSKRMVHAVVYDDRIDVLQEAYQLCTTHPGLLPGQFTAELCYFANRSQGDNANYTLTKPTKSTSTYGQYENTTEMFAGKDEQARIQIELMLEQRLSRLMHTTKVQYYPKQTQSIFSQHLISGKGRLNPNGDKINRDFSKHFGEYNRAWEDCSTMPTLNFARKLWFFHNSSISHSWYSRIKQSSWPRKIHVNVERYSAHVATPTPPIFMLSSQPENDTIAG